MEAQKALPPEQPRHLHVTVCCHSSYGRNSMGSCFCDSVGSWVPKPPTLPLAPSHPIHTLLCANLGIVGADTKTGALQCLFRHVPGPSLVQMNSQNQGDN